MGGNDLIYYIGGSNGGGVRVINVQEEINFAVNEGKHKTAGTISKKTEAILVTFTDEELIHRIIEYCERQIGSNPYNLPKVEKLGSHFLQNHKLLGKLYLLEEVKKYFELYRDRIHKSKQEFARVSQELLEKGSVTKSDIEGLRGGVVRKLQQLLLIEHRILCGKIEE